MFNKIKIIKEKLKILSQFSIINQNNFIELQNEFSRYVNLITYWTDIDILDTISLSLEKKQQNG